MTLKRSTASIKNSTVAAVPRAAERIRSTARELFYREGIRAIGVDEIVNRAGVTKPSLYRSFGSKDALATLYINDYAAEFWTRFDAPGRTHPNDPRAQLLEYLKGLSERATQSGYRGCGMSNAALEYPHAQGAQSQHPTRKTAVAEKRKLRTRLHDMAEAMGAKSPDVLADGLLLLIEGAFASGQMFGRHGPARSLVKMAEQLITASLR
ncbi:TetR/AcrR family transcriptional regulator [Rhodanobacter sp. A1T4]|jgi:AcrR family transcriptional regulator|uniref:TetR/AcrR family transcriptional regulator n=1 Tax=Rhodanobacter sp. A1T4 TaxID=2723087 RepID=UPI00161701BD|nr:TetR/AcrR family transcriptional regulator [Rhodanobacter sp. A1T4]MBB6246584.1 AcrR family transcriptional regulator [Rhodanobacter sp. A1T4]